MTESCVEPRCRRRGGVLFQTSSSLETSAKRTQTWIATRIPNLFLLKESGTYYGRVKLEGKSCRKSFEATSFKVARDALREWLITFKRPEADGGETKK